MSELQEILDGKTTEAAPEPVQAEPAQADGAVAQDNPEPVENTAPEKGDQDTAPPADGVEQTEPEKPDHVPVTALTEERRRRQEAERRALELEAREKAFRDIQQQSQADPSADQSQLEDTFYKDPVAFVQNAVGTVTEGLRISMSEQFIRDSRDDAQEAFDGFAEIARENPHMVAQMRAAPNPGLFAYNAGKMYLDTKDVDSIDSLRAKIEKEVTEKLERKYSQKASEQAAGNVTPSNATARGAGPTSSDQDLQAPKSLEAILGR